jgi:hypothetical protein
MTSSWGGFSTGTWHHLALVRNGSTLSIYIDGVSQALTADVAIGANDVGDVSSPLYIGSDSQYHLNGYIQDLRITKGVARYTADFTPPTNLYIPMDISGIVTDQNNNPVSKKVRLYERVGGELISEQMSSAIDGSYSFNVIENPYNVVVLTEDSNFNDLIRKINV